MVFRRKDRKKRVRQEHHVILPEGMVLLVRNLEATNPPLTEAERLIQSGYSRADVARRLGCSRAAITQALNRAPPRLKNWPIVGSWEERAEDGDVNLTVCAA